MSEQQPPMPPQPPVPPVPPPPPGPQPQGPDVGAGVSWAFAKFKENAGVMLAFAAIILVINAGASGASRLSEAGTPASPQVAENLPTGALLGIGVATLVLSLASIVLTLLAQIGLINSALKITRGERAQFSDLWTPRHPWMYIVVSLLVGFAFGFGLLLCILPGLFVMWAWQFAQYSALDTAPGVFASVGESWQLVSANKGPALLVLLINVLASFVAVATCGLGALVVYPFTSLFTAHMFRQFKGEAIAP